jgi:hypothetical protein
MFRPLVMLGFVHQHRDEMFKAVESIREILIKPLTPPLCYILGPDANFRLAQFYSFLSNKRAAMKVDFFIKIIIIIIFTDTHIV